MSNLPPGVTPNMISGNRPEDMDEELFWEAFESALRIKLTAHQCHLWDAAFNGDTEDILVAAVTTARDMGYERGIADKRMEEDIVDTEIDAGVIERISKYNFIEFRMCEPDGTSV